MPVVLLLSINLSPSFYFKTKAKSSTAVVLMFTD